MRIHTFMTCVHRDTLSCEPIVRRTPSGDLLLVVQCGDTYEPAPGNRVYFFRSTDNGRTWSNPQRIRSDDHHAEYCTEVMVLGDEITAFLTLHEGRFLNWTSMRMISHDSGRTWHEAGPEPNLPTYTFHRGMITLRDGTILIPYQHYPIDEAENARLFADNAFFHGKGAWIGNLGVRIDHIENGVLRSTDGGKTFVRHAAPPYPLHGNTGLVWAWTEPTLGELTDGRIVMLIRVKNDVLWRSESNDGGITWRSFVPTDIPNPSCKAKLIALPKGRIALLHDPSKTQRNPFALWISGNDMQTWQHQSIISDFPLAFDYPDGFWENGHLYISIELQRRDVLFMDIEMDFHENNT